jgi:anti-sigma factor (TIGR02949 family)
MTDCSFIESLVTPYVDDEISASDREAIERHLHACHVCRGRVRAEQAVRALVGARRGALEADAAPPALRARCQALLGGRAPESHRPAPVPQRMPVSRDPARVARTTRARLVPFALAASLVVIVGGAFVYELTARSTQVMAAELTADHVKCFRFVNRVLPTSPDAASVERSMASTFGWQMHLPADPERAGLQLIGARPCLYGEGLAAHIMYSHRGNPVSLFMLSTRARAEQLVEVMGHQAAVWSVGDRTFVLISREPREEVQRLSAFVHGSLR